MRAFSNLFLLVPLLLAIPAVSRADQPVTVFAAASLRDALDEVVKAWPRPVAVSYGGSGQMARQVAAGAPADIIFLANRTWMDWLEDQDAINAASRQDLLGNQLVVVTQADADPLLDLTADAILSRLADGRLAIGNTNGVAAGIYARQWMERTGLWSALRVHLAETENVRAALALVARGEAPLGVVYATDALADPTVDVVYRIDPSMHEAIIYPIAVVHGQPEENIEGFLNFVTGPEQADIFRTQGFLVIEDQK